MSGYQYNNGLYSSGSQHYSHPYAPNGEPSQPLRSSYGLPQLGTNGVENGPIHYQPPYQPSPTPPPQSTTPPFYTEPRRSQSDLAPIPAPVIKSDYAAPVFQTFQERKRAKEQARTQSVGYSPIRASQDHPAATPPLPPSSSRDMPPPVLPRPAPPPPSKSAPLPPIRPSTSRPLPSPIRTHTAPPEAGPSSPRTPVESLERSDTISSVKSLDRGMGFSSPSKRPLPKPPVVVVASKSLDRGMPSGIGAPPVVRAAAPLPRAGDGYEQRTGRRLPSTVTEMSEGSEGDLSGEMGRMSLSRSNSPVKQSPVKPRVALPSPSIPTINVPSIAEPVPRIVEPSVPRIMEPPRIVEPSIPRIMEPPMIVEPPMIIEPPTIIEPGSRPATFQPLPSISIGDDEPEIVFAGLPTIAVSTFDAPAKIPSQPTATRIDPTSAILCTGCTNPIIGRIVSAMGQRWHPQCFMCGECGELLEHVSSYEFNGRPYCHLDYHDKFAHRCHHCKTPIVEPRFITLDDPVLGQRFYHELHFFCSECGDPFLDPSRSSAPGTERTRSSQPEEEETNAFVIQKGHPYCERCHLRLHKPKCKGCKLPIPDLAVDAMGAKWHQDCFVCQECGNGFANSLFFPQDGKAFCTECYGVMVGH